MKIVCTQADLSEALSIVGKAVTQNTTLPVLNNVLLNADKGKLVLSGTNLEVAIQSVMAAEVKVEGKITVPARLLISYISLVNEESLELYVDDSNNLVVKSAGSETKIKGIPADEFPIIPTVDKDSVFKVDRKEFDIAVTQTVFAAAHNTSRPVLSGVLFRVKEGKLLMVATDSYRLAEKSIDLKEPVEFELEAIVPARTVAELGKIINKAQEEDVEINVSKNQILFVIGDTKMVSRLIEGKFPEYEKIIPAGNKTKVGVKTEDLSLIIKRVGLFARENNNNIKVSVTNEGKLVVSTDETKVGEERAEIDAAVEGENNKIALNAQYLLDVLNFINAEEITIELDDKLSPAVIKIKKEDTKSYLYIIMPLKI